MERFILYGLMVQKNEWDENWATGMEEQIYEYEYEYRNNNICSWKLCDLIETRRTHDSLVKISE